MNHIDLIKLAHRADLEGDIELADYLDNQLVRVAILKKIIPNLAKGWEHTRRPNYDIDFSSLKPDASNLDTMIKHPTQTGTNPVAKFFQAGLKTVQRTPERLVEIEKEIKNAILNIASSDPKIDIAKKKVQNNQALTADERNSLLNILVRDQKVATRKNDIAVQDITAVLEGKAPSIPTKEVTTLSKAGKGMAYAGGLGVAANVGLSAFNTAQQSNYKPGELYNNQVTAPGMQALPSGMENSPAYQGGGGGYSGGGGYQGPRYEQPRDESRNYTQVYQPAAVNDQLYGRNDGGRYQTQRYNQESFEGYQEPSNPPAYYEDTVQGPSKYQPIGPTQEEAAYEPIGPTQEQAMDPNLSYSPDGSIAGEGGQAPAANYQEPPYPV